MLQHRFTRHLLFAASLAGMAIPAFARPADAQMKTTITDPGWQLGLSLPRAAESALAAGDGLAWDALRKTGLNLTAKGTGEASLVLFILSVEDGRVTNRWKSRSFSVAAGTRTISGHYLPASRDTTVPGIGTLSRVVQAPRPIDTRALVGTDDVARILPSEMQAGRLLVMFVAPAGREADSSTGALFARTEVMAD